MLTFKKALNSNYVSGGINEKVSSKQHQQITGQWTNLFQTKHHTVQRSHTYIAYARKYHPDGYPSVAHYRQRKPTDFRTQTAGRNASMFAGYDSQPSNGAQNYRLKEHDPFLTQPW